MPLGNPIRKQNESRVVSVLATEGQTVFTVQGGYIINHISVFRNGVRLSNSEDFTAGDGSTVTLNNAANIDDRIEFHVFDRFTVQNAIVSAASTQTISGDVVVNGKIFGNLDVPSINVASGIVTTHDLNVTGVSTFTGDISVDGRSDLDEVNVSTGLNVTGVTTLTNNVEIISGELFINDKITHADDTNTAIRFPAADTITAETGGSEALRVDSSGRLLLGTTTEGAADADNLTIADSGSAGITIRSGTSAAGSLYFSDATSGAAEYDGAILYNHSSKFMAFYANESERARITTTGTVGIATITPAGKLDVHGSGSDAIIRARRLDGNGGYNLFEGYSDVNAASIFYVNNNGLGYFKQRINIGTTTEGNANADDLTVATSGETGITIRSGSSSPGNIFFSDATSGAGEYAGFIDYKHNGDAMTFGTSESERMRITSSGEVLIGHTAAFGHSGIDGHLQVTGTGTDDTSITQTRFSNDQWCPFISMAKSRNGTIGSHTVVQNNDYLGYINFAGSDGTDFNNGAAYIAALVDGTPGTDDMPGRLIFATSADDANSPTERMRITSSGKIGVNVTPSTGQFVVKNSDDSNLNVLEVYNDNGNRSGGFSQNSSGDGTIAGYKNDGSLSVFFRSNGDSYISGGNFALGHSSPSSLFHMAGSAPRITLSDTAGTNDTAKIFSSSGALYLQQRDGSGHGEIIFRTENDSTATERMRIKNDGDVSISDGDLIIGTSGHGIDFSATGGGSNTSSESELFSDYEEGSCTILIHDAAGSNISVTNHGTKYTKIGNRVFIEGKFVFAETGTKNGGLMSLYQLPFTPAQSVQAQGVYWYDGTSDGADVTGVVYINSSGNGYLKQATTIGQPSNNKYLTFNEIQKNSSRPLHFSFSYTI